MGRLKFDPGTHLLPDNTFNIYTLCFLGFSRFQNSKEPTPNFLFYDSPSSQFSIFFAGFC